MPIINDANQIIEFNVCRLESSIPENLYSDRTTLAIFLDISQVFDSVNHNNLTHRLTSLELKRYLLKFIIDFLTDRFITVKNKNIKSDKFPLNREVPQGSIISPIIFNIMVHDQRYNGL